MTFSTTNVRSNRFIETSLDTPVVDLGEVSGNIVLDLGQSTKYKLTIAGNLTITFSNESVTKNLELWVINEGYSVSWPENLSVSNITTPTQVLTYFKLQKIGSIWSEISYKPFFSNPYVPNTTCVKCCTSYSVNNLPCSIPICISGLVACQWIATCSITTSCTTYCCIQPCDTASCFIKLGSISISPEERYYFLGNYCTGGVNVYNDTNGTYNCHNLYTFGVGYVSSGKGSNPIPFGFPVCCSCYGCWDGVDTRNYNSCIQYPLGFDDNGVYYYIGVYNFCSTFQSVGTTCTQFGVYAARLCGVTGNIPSTGYYSTICNQCTMYTCTDSINHSSPLIHCMWAGKKPTLTWLSKDTGVINSLKLTDCNTATDACECITSLMFRCTGPFTYGSTTFQGRILSKAHNAPYFIVNCSYSDQTASVGSNICWNIVYDTNWGTASAPSLSSALAFSWINCFCIGSSASRMNEGLILTGDGCYVITTVKPIACVAGAGWWCGTGCCTATLGCVMIYCRCTASCNFCTTPVCFASSYTDTNNWVYASALRECTSVPWIDGERGSNWWIENVEVACRVSGVTTTYGICFNGTCWVVSSVTYNCLCSTLGYDYCQNLLRANGSLVKCGWPAYTASGNTICLFNSLACPNSYNICNCNLPTTVPGLKTSFNYNTPNRRSTLVNMRSSTVTSYQFTGKPYLEECRE